MTSVITNTSETIEIEKQYPTKTLKYELGRNAYGFEIDRNFYNLAKRQMLADLQTKRC